MRVLALTKYGREAASTRQRLLQYLPALAAAGIEVEVSPLLSSDYMARVAAGRARNPASVALSYARRFGALTRVRSYDLCWVYMEALPYLPAIAERIGLAGRTPYVVDMDDAIFHQYDDSPHAAARALLGRKIASLASRARMVIAGNEYLAAYCRPHAETRIIPTVLDTDAYVPAGRPRPTGSGVVGWIGAPSTWRYVEPMLPVLMPIIREAGWTLRAIGAGPAADGIPGLENLPWSEAGEITAIQSFDIGIMPLPDEHWARGKCGYKLIQYMACGLPTIASPVGVNGDIVNDGATGYLCRDSGQWREGLTALMQDAGLREQFGNNGRERAVSDYSLQAYAPTMVAAFGDAVNMTREGGR